MIKIYDNYYLIDSLYQDDYRMMHLKINSYDIILERKRYVRIWDKNQYDYNNTITISKFIDPIKTKISFSSTIAGSIFEYLNLLIVMSTPFSYILPTIDNRSIVIEGYYVDDEAIQISIIEFVNELSKEYLFIFTFEMINDFIEKFFYFYLNDFYK